MTLIKKISKKWGKRKIRVFSLFLLFSFLAWSISNLSDTYEATVWFQLRYENLPDSLLTTKNTKKEWSAVIGATGFQLLYYQLWPKEVSIDVAKSNQKNANYFMPAYELSRAIKAELAGNVTLKENSNDTLFLEVYQVVSKEVPVRPDIQLELAPNHLLEGTLLISPSSVTIKGPKKEVDGISEIKTAKIRLLDLTQDFTQTAKLVKAGGLKNGELLQYEVQVSGTVVRFSEKIFEAEILVDGLPDGFQFKTFPGKVPLLCKASIERLKELSTDDFEVYVDYSAVKNENMVLADIRKVPEGVYDVRLLENTVKIILEEE